MPGVGCFFVFAFIAFLRRFHNVLTTFIAVSHRPNARKINVFLRTVLHGKLIRHQGDELAVGGFLIGQRHAAAKGAVERVNTPAAPGNLDGVADSALHLAGAGIKAPGDGGVELFGDAVDAVRVFDHQFDGFAQELIALDVRRNAKTEKNIDRTAA